MNYRKYSFSLIVIAYYCVWGLHWSSLCFDDSYKSCDNAAVALGITGFPISSLFEDSRDVKVMLGVTVAGAIQWFAVTLLAEKYSCYSRIKNSKSYIVVAIVSLLLPVLAIAVTFLSDVISDMLSPVGGAIFIGTWLILAYHKLYMSDGIRFRMMPLLIMALSLITFSFLLPFFVVAERYTFEQLSIFISTESDSVVTAIFSIITLMVVSLVGKTKQRLKFNSVNE